ncbi:hypothetical protein [Streptomyces olivochromogenes]|uniref:Uncharacterized protein n=1 Tax=Streptomyces olivochromogenes TaxID=1963 RepID=A0A250VF77_STROL|nr:hypothetical protein [Streptomyces olivochromogenes]KUN47421.1 hypothetical protein AQJ27_10825 [Streptomyces olivochromogenes]GAX52837.1 hypothetical protein SO3561_04356 [Streptomyces olivochromogenes]
MTQRNLLAPAANLVTDEALAKAHRQAVVDEAETAVSVEMLRLTLAQLGKVLRLTEEADQ